MIELLHSFFHPLPNAIMSILVIIAAFYWVMTFIAGDFLGDIDVDLGLDSEEYAYRRKSSFFIKMLAFVNVGKVPIMLVLSIFQLIAWLLSLITCKVLDVPDWGAESALILIPIFIVSYFLTRFATHPFIKIYNAMGYKGEKHLQLTGKIAIMKSTIQGEKIGDAEIVIYNDVIRVMVKSIDGEPLNYQTQIILVEESEDKKFYWAKA